MEGRVEIPRDDAGYIRRQCPRCERAFKLLYQGDSEAATQTQVLELYCPYCGIPSPSDQFWTNEQVETFQAAAGKLMLDDLKRRGFQVSVNPPPPPLYEPNDMTAVASPCHADEPVKIIDIWEAAIHCPVCGQGFTI